MDCRHRDRAVGHGGVDRFSSRRCRGVFHAGLLSSRRCRRVFHAAIRRSNLRRHITVEIGHFQVGNAPKEVVSAIGLGAGDTSSHSITS